MLNLSDRTPLNLRDSNQNFQLGAFCSFPKPQTCENCLMDTTDPEILFNSSGICSYCSDSKNLNFVRVGSEPKNKEIQILIDKITKESKNNEYDCLVGISGGVDSSYLARLVVEWNLTPLFVHVDAGWNTNVANENINKLLDVLNQEVYTVVIDWNRVKSSQVAFLKSGIANQDVPQDYLFSKSVLEVARKFKIKSILSGSNLATESVLPKQWGYNSQDSIHINAIQKVFIKDNQNGVEVKGFAETVLSQKLNRTTVHRPLNLIPYSRNMALNSLGEFCGWQDYGPKHFESRWTRYFQGYYLPLRYGYDKRKPHLSSRIHSGELSKAEALREMNESKYNLENRKEDEIFICNKLGISETFFEALKCSPLSHYSDFANQEKLINALKYLKKFLPK
jgi:N-acetyl sugar amidotransferase